MFKNINLEGYTVLDEVIKLQEEVREFQNEILKEDKDKAIEEAWDVLQATISCLQMIGVYAEEFEEGAEKHYRKMEQRGNKPRVKGDKNEI